MARVTSEYSLLDHMHEHDGAPLNSGHVERSSEMDQRHTRFKFSLGMSGAQVMTLRVFPHALADFPTLATLQAGSANVSALTSALILHQEHQC